MSEAPAPTEEYTWRKRFAARANNRGWALTEQGTRSPAEDEEMLDAAHAAMHLWSTIGDARHCARARLLLAQVHALLGNPRYAMPYARSAHAYITSNPSEPWEIAMAQAVLASAAYSAGDAALHESNYRAAAALIAKMPDAEDRKVLEATLKVVPAPAGGTRAAN
jgi:hypothetical protein